MTESLEFKKDPLYKTTFLYQCRRLEAAKIRLLRTMGFDSLVRWLNRKLKAAGL